MPSAREAFEAAWGAVTRLLAPPPLLEAAASRDELEKHWGSEEYDSEHAASAIAGHPWVRVGVEAVAMNASQVPIRVYDPKTRKPIDSHWILDLLRRPDPSMGPKRWRQQLVADLKTSGDLFCVKTTIGGRVTRLRRRHPRGWTVVTDAMGDIVGWRDSKGREYPAEDIFHVSLISWRDDAAMQHLGESPIRPLDLGIKASIASRKQAAAAAKRGRLETLVSSRSPMGEGGAKRISDRIEDIRRGGTGTLVVGHDLQVQPLSLAPRDTEWEKLTENARDEALAVLGVPPVRAQLPSANYGAAKQEMRQYWENIRALTDLIDEELTELAGYSVIVKHSYEAVEALQTSYTERLARVKMWVDLGATPYRAAVAEGFTDPPLDLGTEPRAAQQNIPPNPATQTDTPQARTVDLVAEELIRAGEYMQDTVDVGISGEPLTRHALADRLRSGPLAPMADEVADTLVDAVEYARRGTGRIKCDTLSAFGRDHATMLTEALAHV